MSCSPTRCGPCTTLCRAGTTATNNARARSSIIFRTLIDRTGALDTARMTVLGAALGDAVNRCAEAKQWDRANTLASWLLDRCGGEQHERLLAAMIAGQVLAGLADSQDESASRANAARLAEAIQRIEGLRTRAPRNATLFDCLAELQLRMAIQLANGGRLSDGLVAVQKSVTYDLRGYRPRDVRVKLTELMTRLRHEAEMLRARVASTPNATLTGQGQELVRKRSAGSRRSMRSSSRLRRVRSARN